MTQKMSVVDSGQFLFTCASVESISIAPFRLIYCSDTEHGQSG